MDNALLRSIKTNEAVSKYKEAKETFLMESMSLRKFVSNDKRFNKFIEDKETRKIPKPVKVLGIPSPKLAAFKACAGRPGVGEVTERAQVE